MQKRLIAFGSYALFWLAFFFIARLFLFLFTIILFVSFFIYFYNRLISKLFSNFERIRYWLPGILFSMVLWGALIIPIRGGFGVAPINAGTVYFSEKMLSLIHI